jgi:hypothetical protein
MQARERGFDAVRIMGAGDGVNGRGAAADLMVFPKGMTGPGTGSSRARDLDRAAFDPAKLGEPGLAKALAALGLLGGGLGFLGLPPDESQIPASNQ